MSELIPPLLFQIGVGGIFGFLVGYAIKKVVKIIAVILGLFALGLLFLGYKGIIDINYTRLAEEINRIMVNITGTQWLTLIISNLPFAGTFTLCMVYGFNKG